jgi:hypothetical protein
LASYAIGVSVVANRRDCVVAKKRAPRGSVHVELQARDAGGDHEGHLGAGEVEGLAARFNSFDLFTWNLHRCDEAEDGYSDKPCTSSHEEAPEGMRKGRAIAVR